MMNHENVAKELEKVRSCSTSVENEVGTAPSCDVDQFGSEDFTSFHTSDETLKEESLELSESGNVPKDGFWSWVACMVAVMDQLLLFGTLNVYSLFLVQFQKELGCSTAEAAWLGSMTMGLMKLFGPVASSLSMHFGNRRIMMFGAFLCSCSLLISSFVPNFELLFATMSLPFGLGSALVITPACVVPVEYFKKHQSVTMGIVAAGSSIGTLVLAPTIQITLNSYGWRVTYQCLSVFCFILIFLNLLIQPRKRNPTTYIHKPILKSMIEDLGLWKNRVFLLWVLSIAIVYFGYQIPVIFLASYAVFIGSTPLEASYIFVVMGAATTLSRLLTGSLLKCDLLSRLHVKQIIFVVLGTSYLLLTHINTVAGLYVFAVVRGLLDGAHIVMLPMLTASMVGASKALLGWGHLAGAISVTYTLGPVSAGAIKDFTGSYTLPFIMAGLPLIAAGLVLFLLPWAQRTSKKINMLRRLSQIHQVTRTMMGDRLGGGGEKMAGPLTYTSDDDPVSSIQDLIQFTASMSEMSRKFHWLDLQSIEVMTSQRSSSCLGKMLKKPKGDPYFYPTEMEKAGWQRPLSGCHSDTHVFKLKKQQKPQPMNYKALETKRPSL